MNIQIENAPGLRASELAGYASYTLTLDAARLLIASTGDPSLIDTHGAYWYARAQVLVDGVNVGTMPYSVFVGTDGVPVLRILPHHEILVDVLFAHLTGVAQPQTPVLLVA